MNCCQVMPVLGLNEYHLHIRESFMSGPEQRRQSLSTEYIREAVGSCK